MENKNQGVIIGLLVLIVGLLLGYFFGNTAMPHRGGFFWNESMYEEMEEHMGGFEYEDEILNSDGELQHMMDEMMLIGRGHTGADYEQAWLRGMIVHHLGAIAMSEKLLEETDRPELKELANSIIENQTSEVEQMKEWLNAWFN